MSTADTLEKHVCIVGWPVSHSRSPLIHQYWIEKYGLKGDYTKKELSPDEAPNFFETFGEQGFCGANVTLPHKVLAFEKADEADETAKAVGAANTLWMENGELCASNTDVYGFITYLNEEMPDWDYEDRPAVVLGAGGAARAVIHGLLTEGVEQIKLVNRTRENAQALADIYGSKIKVFDWDDRSKCLQDASLLVNTTELGMEGKEPLDINLATMPIGSTVADIVYTPLETDLLVQAQSIGLQMVDGLGMLLHQAVPGFEKWFGVRPEVTSELRALLIADLDTSA